MRVEINLVMSEEGTMQQVSISEAAMQIKATLCSVHVARCVTTVRTVSETFTLTINPRLEDFSNLLVVGFSRKNQFQKRRKTPKPTTSKFQ